MLKQNVGAAVRATKIKSFTDDDYEKFGSIKEQDNEEFDENDVEEESVKQKTDKAH